jgi:predicted DNA-binding protein
MILLLLASLLPIAEPTLGLSDRLRRRPLRLLLESLERKQHLLLPSLRCKEDAIDDAPSIGPDLSDACYCMSMYSHRLQILLDDRRHERLAAAARERGVSVATVVREAIDRGLPDAESRRQAAARALLEAPDMAVPDAAGLREELDALRGRRG